MMVINEDDITIASWVSIVVLIIIILIAVAIVINSLLQAKRTYQSEVPKLLMISVITWYIQMA